MNALSLGSWEEGRSAPTQQGPCHRASLGGCPGPLPDKGRRCGIAATACGIGATNETRGRALVSAMKRAAAMPRRALRDGTLMHQRSLCLGLTMVMLALAVLGALSDARETAPAPAPAATASPLPATPLV